MSHSRRTELTLALLCKQEVSLCCSRQVRDTVARIQQSWAHNAGQSSVRLDRSRLVVAELTARDVSILPCAGLKYQLTFHRGI